MEDIRALINTSATRVVASTFGVLVGLAGIEHGYFELLQGDVRPGSITFVHRKNGAGVLLLLSIMLFLVGGGFGPIFLAILASATATRIDKPLRWWRAHLPVNVRGFLTKLWPWSIVASVLLFVISVEIAIFGYPLVWFFGTDTTFTIQYTSAYIMLGLMLLSVLTGFAHDIQKQAELNC